MTRRLHRVAPYHAIELLEVIKRGSKLLIQNVLYRWRIQQKIIVGGPPKIGVGGVVQAIVGCQRRRRRRCQWRIMRKRVAVNFIA